MAGQDPRGTRPLRPRARRWPTPAPGRGARRRGRGREGYIVKTPAAVEPGVELPERAGVDTAGVGAERGVDQTARFRRGPVESAGFGAAARGPSRHANGAYGGPFASAPAPERSLRRSTSHGNQAMSQRLINIFVYGDRPHVHSIGWRVYEETGTHADLMPTAPWWSTRTPIRCRGG